jgi:anti-sigma factor RsiW
MACDVWRGKIAAYADGELPAGEMRAMGNHLRGCASCTLDLLNCVQMKRTIKSAGMRYSASQELRVRVQKEFPAKKKSSSYWGWLPRLAAGIAAVGIIFLLIYRFALFQQGRTIAELADLHVATLASANAVDVVSTDRHTVKPWFQGRIPFTFNLPELGNTRFTLEGGRVSYLDQAPGAQLIFRIGNHRISVFIFQNRVDRFYTSSDTRANRLTFNVEIWSEGDLRYYVIGDANADDLHGLSELLKTASRH